MAGGRAFQRIGQFPVPAFGSERARLALAGVYPEVRDLLPGAAGAAAYCVPDAPAMGRGVFCSQPHMAQLLLQQFMW
jgi:hypothetical protein